MRLIKKITNGILLIFLGIMHSQFAFSANGFQKQMLDFSKTYFYKISGGMAELPAAVGHTNFESFSYLIMVLLGCYMIPDSGMTRFMLPHALYMLISNSIKAKKRNKVAQHV